MATEFQWLQLRFGKHEGKTLPQIVLSDPDYFFWAVSVCLNTLMAASTLGSASAEIVVVNNAREQIRPRLITAIPRSSRTALEQTVESRASDRSGRGRFNLARL
jgi:hypothetical protein